MGNVHRSRDRRMKPAQPRPLQQASVVDVPTPNPSTSNAPAVDQWRVEFPHLARTYDVPISFGRGGSALDTALRDAVKKISAALVKAAS